jgi:hypothetical protein
MVGGLNLSAIQNAKKGLKSTTNVSNDMFLPPPLTMQDELKKRLARPNVSACAFETLESKPKKESETMQDPDNMTIAQKRAFFQNRSAISRK